MKRLSTAPAKSSIREELPEWPETKYVCMEDICLPLRRAFDQIVTVKRGASRKKIKWDGFRDIPSMSAMTVEPQQSLSDMNFRRRKREDGMDVLDIVIQIAVQLGMDGGWKDAEHSLQGNFS